MFKKQAVELSWQGAVAKVKGEVQDDLCLLSRVIHVVEYVFGSCDLAVLKESGLYIVVEPCAYSG